MGPSKFSEEQIAGILREPESGRKAAGLRRALGGDGGAVAFQAGADGRQGAGLGQRAGARQFLVQEVFAGVHLQRGETHALALGAVKTLGAFAIHFCHASKVAAFCYQFAAKLYVL